MPEGRLERTREVYATDQMIAICPHCEEPLTDDHDCQDAHDDIDANETPWAV